MKKLISFMLIIISVSAFAANNAPAKVADADKVIAPQPLVPAANYDRYTEMFEIYYNNRLAKVVMMGDSITQGAYWNELLQRGDVINRGIPGDTTQGMLDRLASINPGGIEKAFMMMGINDIAKHRPVEEIAERYIRVIEFLTRSGIKAHIQSTLFQSSKNKNYIENNKQVGMLNKLLKVYAINNGLEYVDLNAVLSDGKAMIDDYTYDGTHLNAKGYTIWRSVLMKYLAPVDKIEEPAATDTPVDNTVETPVEVPAAQ